MTCLESGDLTGLIFLNGYLDMTTGMFYKDFDPDIVFFNRIQRNYTIKESMRDSQTLSSPITKDTKLRNIHTSSMPI